MQTYANVMFSGRNVDQIVIPFTRNEHNRHPAVQNLNARIEANFVIKNWWPLSLGNDFVKLFSVLLISFCGKQVYISLKKTHTHIFSEPSRADRDQFLTISKIHAFHRIANVTTFLLFTDPENF